MAYKKDGDLKRAEDYYNQSLALTALDRDKALCYNGLARVYKELENMHIAENFIDKAMQYVDPNNISDFIDIYDTYVDIKDTEESAEKLLEALEGAPQNIYMPYVIQILSKIICKITDIERVKRIVMQYIIQSKDNSSTEGELFKLLGTLVFNAEVKK